MRRRITPATVIATVALFMTMGGVGYAAQHYLITSTKQIKPSVLRALKGATGPQGAPSNLSGAAGPAGAQGAAGPAGSQGASGATGPDGATGPAGAQGANGANGANGTNGTNGPQGPQGANGTNGTNGTAGTAGADGKDGTDGTQGPVGPAGAQGPAGPAGAQGAPGSQGTQGPAGPAGAQGTSGVNSPLVYSYADSVGPDSGYCGDDWAEDTYDRTFVVEPQIDGSFTMAETFQGTFVTRVGVDDPNNCSRTQTGNVDGTFYGTETFSVPSPGGGEAADFNPFATCGSDCSPHTTGTTSSADAGNTAFVNAFFPGATMGPNVNYDFVYTTDSNGTWTDSNTPGNETGGAGAGGDITG